MKSPNYAEASEAESPADFIHKLKLAQFASRFSPGAIAEYWLLNTETLPTPPLRLPPSHQTRFRPHRNLIFSLRLSMRCGIILL